MNLYINITYISCVLGILLSVQQCLKRLLLGVNTVFVIILSYGQHIKNSYSEQRKTFNKNL